MNSNQVNDLNMFDELNLCCLRYKMVWELDPVFSSSFNDFISFIQPIKTNRDIQITPTRWARETKEQKKEIVFNAVTFIRKRTQSYANTVKNYELLSNINFSDTYLKRERQSNFVGICTVIMNKVVEYKTDLVDYGISEEKITEALLAIEELDAAIPETGIVRSDTKAATERLLVLFSGATAIQCQKKPIEN
jgi:hypothetical protein